MTNSEVEDVVHPASSFILERDRNAVMIFVEDDRGVVVVVVVVVASTEEDCVVVVAVTLIEVPLVGPFPSSNWK